MNDLQQYYSLINDLKSLKDEVRVLEYKLDRMTRAKNKIKSKYDKLRDTLSPHINARSNNARVLIKQKWHGGLKITLKEIAKKVHMSEVSVRMLSSEIRKIPPT